MHMHKMFMKMHKKHRGPPPHEMFHGKHGFGHHMMFKPRWMWQYMMPGPHEMGPHMMRKPHKMDSHMDHISRHKPHIMGHHKMHPPMFHGMHHGKHGKHHHMKHHRRPSFSSSSSSSESEDEFPVEEQLGKNNTKDCPPNQGHSHKKPSPDMRHGPVGRPCQISTNESHEMLNYIPEPGEVLPFMKPTRSGQFHMKHRLGPHKMHPRKFHKKHEMRHHFMHKSGRRNHGHHKMHKTEGAGPIDGMHFHKMHHHKMHKKPHHMKHRGRCSSHSSSSSSDSENDAPVPICSNQSGDK